MGPAAEDSVNGARSGTQAVERAIAILECLRGDRTPIGITEVARTVGINISTAHRLVRAMVAAGYVERDDLSERYRLGVGIAVLGQRAMEQTGYHHAKPVLEALAEATGESVSLGIRRDGEVMIIERAASPQPLRFDHPVGGEIHVHASAMGKVLLAFSGVTSAEAVAPLGDLSRFTKHTIVSPDALANELDHIRAAGSAVNREERYDGVSGLAAPVLGRPGWARAAVGIQGPSARLTPGRLKAITPLVRHAADELAARLA